MNENTDNNQLVVGLALIGGLGLILMSVALAVGVIQGENASTNIIGMVFFTGLVLLFGGTAGWFGVTQPHKHIDDINVPQYTGHHDHHDSEDH